MSALMDILARFDPAYYSANNPDVGAAKLDPRQHYVTYGMREGRKPNADEGPPSAPPPPPSTMPLNPRDPAAWAAYRQAAHDSTAGINRLPRTAPNTATLSEDNATNLYNFYPQIGQDVVDALMKQLGINSGADQAAKAGAMGGLTGPTLSNFGMKLGPEFYYNGVGNEGSGGYQ